MAIDTFVIRWLFWFSGGGTGPTQTIESAGLVEGSTAVNGHGANGSAVGAAVLESFDLQHDLGAGWVSFRDDTRVTDPIVAQYGINGDTLTDRVASPGRLTYALNNAHDNTGGVAGYYSPQHANVRPGFDFDIPVRWTLTFAGVTYIKFRGTLSKMDVVPGICGERITRCAAVDQMDDWMRIAAPPLPVFRDTTDDVIVNTVLDALVVPPIARSVDVGLETYEIAYDDAFEERVKVREVLVDVAASGLGSIYLVGNTTTGGELRSWNRHHTVLAHDVQYHFDNDLDVATDSLVVPGLRDDLYSSVNVTSRPTRVDELNDTVLWALQTARVRILPGQTNNTLFGGYRDPLNTGTRIGGEDMQPLVAGIDYIMNTEADGSGTDVTANFTASASFTGSGVRFTIVNTSTSEAGYVVTLQCRGRGIYRTTVNIERTVASGYTDRPLNLVMPYQNDTNVAQDAADYLAAILSQPIRRAKSLTFAANKTATRMRQALAREPGDRIAITETMVGLNAAEYLIRRVKLEMRENKTLWCTWGLEPADVQRYWIWGEARFGSTTVFGF